MSPSSSSNLSANWRTKILFIVGPTASGKSQLALEVAQLFDGEIICADSQTIRRDLNIGTAKPTRADQKFVAHHMLDLIDPYERFSAADFQARANTVTEDIRKRGRLPIVVGGTGLYIDALLYDFSFRNTADPQLRAELEQLSVAELQRRIMETGIELPNNPENPRHLVRTLESGGLVALNKKMRPDAVVIGLNPGFKQLEKRIATRVAAMIKAGLVDEVKAVVSKYGGPPHHWDAIGYKIVLNNMDMDGRLDESYVAQAIARAHRQYAKRQIGWFKRNNQIAWFEQSEDAIEHLKRIFV